MCYNDKSYFSTSKRVSYYLSVPIGRATVPAGGTDRQGFLGGLTTK